MYCIPAMARETRVTLRCTVEVDQPHASAHVR